MGSLDYLLHYFRRLQDNNFDISLLCSGSKGFGKGKLGYETVYCKNGEIKTIDEIRKLIDSKVPIKITTINEASSKIENKKVTAVNECGDNRIIKFTTRGNYTFEITHDHIHYIWKDMTLMPIEANKIKNGDCVISCSPVLQEIEIEPDHIVEMIALLISDGYYGRYNCMYFTNSREELFNIFKRALGKERVYELEQVKIPNTEKTKAGKTREMSYEVKARDEQLRLKLYNLGLLKVTSGDKTVPQFIMETSMRQKAMFLNLLFSCDGCVEKRGVISYCSKSPKLIQQIQLMLKQFEIFASIRTKTVKGENYYEIIISLSHAITFQEKIGLTDIKKSERLKEASEDYNAYRAENGVYAMFYMEPYFFKYLHEKYKEYYKIKGIKWKSKGKPINENIRQVRHLKVTITNGGWIQKNYILKYLEELKPFFSEEQFFKVIYEKVHQNIHLNFFKVSKIEHYETEEMTYNLEVEDNHNYFSGNNEFFLTHNSSAAISIAMKYIDNFSFVCPKCKNEFYKNVFAIGTTPGGTRPRFVKPSYIKDVWIKCPVRMKLDMRTGKKTIESGCGHEFPYSQRRKIKWEASRFIAYDNKDLMNKLYNSPQNSPIIIDEAMNVIAGQNHNKTEVKFLKQLLTVVRPKRYILIFCVPEVSWIDSKVREGMSSFWLRMIERGTGILFEKDKGETVDKYHVKDIAKIMGTIKFFTPMEKVKNNMKKIPTYFDIFNFSALPDEVYDDYELVRNALNLQRQVEEVELSNKDIAKIMTYNLMKQWQRIKISVDRGKGAALTYDILGKEILVNPVTRQPLCSDVTARNWIRGVEDFVASKGKDAKSFEGQAGEVNEEKDGESGKARV